MYVIAYYIGMGDYNVSHYEIMDHSPGGIPAFYSEIPIANVPDGFFETHSAYRVAGPGSTTLETNGTAINKRVIVEANLSADIKSLPWAIERVNKINYLAIL